MSKGAFNVPELVNEPVLSYAPGSAERKALQQAYDDLFKTPIDAPMFIGGKEVRTGKTKPLVCPHDHQHNLGQYHVGGAEHVTHAIEAGLAAKKLWELLPWEQRAAIFLKVCRSMHVCFLRATAVWRQRLQCLVAAVGCVQSHVHVIVNCRPCWALAHTHFVLLMRSYITRQRT